MIIQTLNRDYYMIQRLKHSQEMDIYLCKDNNDESAQEIYRLIRIKNSNIAQAAISIFMEQKDNKANKNFVDCFPKDGEFYVVFINYNDDSMERKLHKEQCSLTERLEIGKNIIEKMILLNIPYFMQYEALDVNNLTVSASLEIGFNFTLENLGEQDIITVSQVIQEYGRVCSLLFKDELSIEASEDLMKLINRLEIGDFNNYFLVYQEYNSVYFKLRELDKIGQVKPRGFWFRTWEKTKKIVIRLKPFIFTAILILIVGYLIYMLMHSNASTESQAVFKSIGTIPIEEPIEKQTE